MIPFYDAKSLDRAIKLTINNLVKKKVNYGEDNLAVSRCFESKWERIWSLQLLSNLLQKHGLTDALYKSIGKEFQFYAPKKYGKIDHTLVTGYYEPVLQGSLTPSARFRFPLYSLPESEELRTLSRRSIDYENGLAGKRYELVWLDSDIDRFFLHIQGSGVVELENGELLKVGYAGKNSQAYTALGRVLVERGLLDLASVTMKSIKATLNNHLEVLPELLSKNESYVYFEVRKQGATGSLGVELTPWRSFASDPQTVPIGSIGLIGFGTNVYGIMISQDTGGAIKGSQHIDVFTGRGENAGSHAGQMKELREVYYLARRECYTFEGGEL